MKINKKEKKIVIISILITGMIVAGFTLSQGNLKSKEDNYASLNDTSTIDKYKVNEDEYEIINKDEETNIFTIYAKRKFNSKEMAYITNQLIQNNENMDEKYEIYIFDEIEIAKNFNGEVETVQTKIVPSSNNKIQIQNHYSVEIEEDIIPKDYKIYNIEENNDTTKIEMIIKGLKDPREAISQIRFIGSVIRNENPNKNLGTLNIVAYTNSDKQESFEYDGQYKTKIINNVYEKIK
ncbi:hypothetical protein [Romboutsia sp.]|uniref:hypothetical protein n=1 Tax=Romboutsia sp. TaxID=1965302 RepID=UPI003F38AB58